MTPPTRWSRRRFGGRLMGSLGLGAWMLPAMAGTPLWRAEAALLGTRVRLQVPLGTLTPPQLEAAWQAALTEMRRLEAQMSRFQPDSVVSRLARHAGGAAQAVSPELMAVLQRAQALARHSDGAFDCTIGPLSACGFDRADHPLPSEAQVRQARRLVGWRGLQLDPARGLARLHEPGMALDLGGVAKLPILQTGLQRLQALGVTRALLDGGGDLLALAAPADPPWQLGLRDGAAPERLLAVLPLRQGVLASSGDYERMREVGGRRYHHVLDPLTGYPSQGVHGVSLLGETVAQVNGLGAAAMVMGPARGARWLASQGVPSLLVGADGQVWADPALAARLRPPPGATQVRGLG